MIQPIQFIDLKRQHEPLKDEIENAIRSVIEKNSFVLGEEVEEFEKSFAAYCGTKECVGVSSGVDAIFLSLKALGIGPGDEVITTTHTFIATAFAISRSGAKPVLVDCNEHDFNIDTEKIEGAIAEKTKAIIVCSPNNPTGSIISREDLQVLGNLAREHGYRPSLLENIWALNEKVRTDKDWLNILGATTENSIKNENNFFKKFIS